MYRNRPITVYEMHIFKDADNTSWKNPQVYTFPLTDNAAAPFLRDKGRKGGLVNLRRCSPAQLSFLKSHLEVQNASLKSARDEEKKEQKAKDLRRKEEEKKEEEKRMEEITKWHQSMQEKTAKLKEEEEERKKDKGDKATGLTNPEEQVYQHLIFQPTPGSYPVMPCNPRRGRENTSPAYGPYSPGYNNLAPPPPPPPQPFYGNIQPSRYPPPRRVVYDRVDVPTPLEKESDWSIECVELDLVPIVTKLKAKKLKAASLGSGQRPKNHVNDYRSSRRSRGILPTHAYQLADSANAEFAVVYSRTVMTVVPEAIRIVQPINDRVYYANTYSDDSVYEDDSERDMEDEDEDEDEENKEGEDKDKEEEEEDLEIVEGFRHCHPITESMSKCCLEK